MTVFIPKMDDVFIVSSLLSIIGKFKDVNINDSDLFLDCIMVMLPVRVTSGWLSVMYSRYQGTCTLQSCSWPQQVVVHDSDWGEASPHASNIVFSECQAAAGLRFLGRQLSAKTSLLLVTGLEHSGRVIRVQWDQQKKHWAYEQVTSKHSEYLMIRILDPRFNLLCFYGWYNDRWGMWRSDMIDKIWDGMLAKMKCEKVTVPPCPPLTDHTDMPGVWAHLCDHHPEKMSEIRISLICGEKYSCDASVL